MILLWGLPEEAPMAAVLAALEKRGCPVAMLDQRQLLATEIELSVAAKLDGVVRCGDRVIRLADVTAAYLRPYDLASVESLAYVKPGSREWRHAADLAEALWTWAELTPARVINRPGAMASNASKPFQAALICDSGFATPETLITNDECAARSFWKRHSAVIYKSISSQRSIVTRLSDVQARRWPYLAACPTQFQKHVPGTDHRVHVVGDEVFACEIESEADDYRYARQQDAAVEMRSCKLPKDCAQRCRDLVAKLGLLVGGVDLRRTPQGQWYCFEVNPSPAFTYYQCSAGQPIAEAIARLLVERPRRDPVPNAPVNIRELPLLHAAICPSGRTERALPGKRQSHYACSGVTSAFGIQS